MKVRRALILPDIHVPYHDTLTLSAVEKLMADLWIDEYINLGDLMDFDEISSFNADNLRELETRRLLEDYKIANDILDRHQKIIRKRNKKAQFTLIEGNHEERMQKLIDRNPQLEGLIEVPIMLHLEERGFKWVPQWSTGELYSVGNLTFLHGGAVNQYHTKKMVDDYSTNLVYGHTHDVQSHSKKILGKNKVVKATSLGHLCDEYKLGWMKKRPSNWCQAIGIVEFRPGGDFNLFVIEIIDHTFSYNGKVYKP